MRDAVIVDAVRTPVGKGKPGGAYSGVHAVDLHAQPIRSVLERVEGLDPAEVDDVIGGAPGRWGSRAAPPRGSPRWRRASRSRCRA